MMRTLLPFAALLVLTACNNRAENNDATDMDSTATADSSSAQPPAATAPDTVFTAFGNEPFWALYVIRDEKLLFHPADGPDVEVPWVAPTEVDERTQRYSSSGDSATIELNIVRRDCSDGMSDMVHRFETRIKVNAATYNGCGRE